jgi:hypothetical protein
MTKKCYCAFYDGSLAEAKLESWPRVRHLHCSFAYSALACFRMGISGSASFQRVRKSL